MVPMPGILGVLQDVSVGLKREVTEDDPSSAVAPHYSAEQQFNLQVLATVFSSISVISALLAFYWFRRMRRSFRHDLIMFLIQSDMFKALWFLVYPILVFAHGPVASDSTFCIANGFLIALGIEASDFAVLMIALHSALYIFNAKNRSSSGEGGLYPYRRYAFICWIVFPFLMASLAFINDQPYVGVGTYCYLPVRPFWYRLALSWVPRYVIFAIILVVYGAIYIYVHFKFKGFGVDGTLEGGGTDGPEFDTVIGAHKHKRHDIPATPPLAYNGLISGTGSRHNSLTESIRSQYVLRRDSEGSLDDPPLSPTRLNTANSTTRLFWSREPRLNSEGSGLSTLVPSDLHPKEIDIPAHPATRSHVDQPSSSTSKTWSSAKRAPSTPTSFLSFFTFLHSHPQHPHTPASSIASTPTNQLQLTNSRGQGLAVSELQKTRERIRRQLRFMFIYPLVYITMWIVPFVSHVLQYQDKYALNPPYVLSACALVFINLQCAVDAWLFSTREKPWRHIPGTNGGFLESLKFWEASWGLPESMRRRSTVAAAGRSRAEMDVEARRAYRRRDAELAAQKAEYEAETARPVAQMQTIGKNWWDHDMPLGGDGPSFRRPNMSPVLEEVGPFDQPETKDEFAMPGIDRHAMQQFECEIEMEKSDESGSRRNSNVPELGGILRQDFVQITYEYKNESKDDL